MLAAAKTRMRELAAAYAKGLPGLDTHSLLTGLDATLRFLPMAVKAGIEVRFLNSSGDGKIDPDLLFLEKGLAAYDEVRRHAESAMSFACRAALPDPATASAPARLPWNTCASSMAFTRDTASRRDPANARHGDERRAGLGGGPRARSGGEGCSGGHHATFLMPRLER